MAQKESASTVVAKTAIIHNSANIGCGTRIWEFVQIAEYAQVGENCVIGNGAYIDRYVVIGNGVRIHNKALLYQGVEIGDNVFIGPAVCFTNDPWPKSGQTRNMQNVIWKVGKGSSIGANVTVLPDRHIGEYSVIGAATLVSSNVPDFALFYGNPGRVQGVVCSCGAVYKKESLAKLSSTHFNCQKCDQSLPVLKVHD